MVLRPSTRETFHVTCDGDFWRSLTVTQPLVQLSEMAGGKVLNGMRQGQAWEFTVSKKSSSSELDLVLQRWSMLLW